MGDLLKSIEAGKALKKTETVIKEASLKEQQEGEKVASLAGTNPIAAGINADTKNSLKKTETVEKQASLKDQLEGEKATALKGTNPLAAAIAEKNK